VHVDYLLRLHQCKQCNRIFYYNADETYPFPRYCHGHSDGSSCDARLTVEQELMRKYRAANESYEGEARAIEGDLDRSIITGRILVLILVVQLMSAFFVSGQASLQDFSRPEVVILLGLAISTVVLVVLQMRSSKRLTRRQQQLRDSLRHYYRELASHQQLVDLTEVASTAYKVVK